MDLHKLNNEIKWLNLLHDLTSKFFEIIDNKRVSLSLRKQCIEEYLLMIYMNNEEYIDHIKYLRKRYIEHENYKLHQSIGISASKLIKNSDLDSYISDLENCIFDKDSTDTAKRASIVQLVEFIINSNIVTQSINRLLKFGKKFFIFISENKDIIEKLDSSVTTKIYKLGERGYHLQLIKSLNNIPNEEDANYKSSEDVEDNGIEDYENQISYRFIKILKNLKDYKRMAMNTQNQNNTPQLDQKSKEAIINNIPEFFLRIYDNNKISREATREILNIFFLEKNEIEIIHEKWKMLDKSFTDAVNNQNNFKRRIAGAYAFSDLIMKVEWPKIITIYEKLFNISLKLANDENQNVQQAAFNLLKTLREITLKCCKNKDSLELKETIEKIMPIILRLSKESCMREIKLYFFSLL